MSPASSVVAATSFTWLGMVLAISFLEAPLKFRAPGVTLRLGLGIGRLVFRALNRVELVLWLIVVVAVAMSQWSVGQFVAVGCLTAILAAQLLLVRPALNRRSDRILAGETAPRSRAHHAYVVFEVVKVVALLGAGISALGA